MSYGTCKKCGCTDKNACYSDLHGPCWWADETHELCSLCEEPFADDKTIVRPDDFAPHPVIVGIIQHPETNNQNTETSNQ